MTVRSVRRSLILSLLAIALTAPLAFAQEADLAPAAAIPTLSPLAFALLGLTLALAGFFVLRGRWSLPTP